MKKGVFIAAALALAAVSAIAGGRLLTRTQAISVSLATVQSHPIRRLLTLSGKVESAHSQGVYTDVACIAGEVLVKAGETVEKGDVLFTVDADATRQVAATLGGSATALEQITLPTEVEAPVRGVVSTVNVRPGEAADPSVPCVVISSGEELQVKLAVPEKELPNITPGQQVLLSGVAFEKQAYRGTVTSLAPTARLQTQGVSGETVVDAVVTVEPADVDESLLIGLTATATVTLDESPQALIVPFSAVMQEDDGQEYVYLYRDGRAVKRRVTTGRAAENGFETISGLKEGDRLVTDPQRITADGMAVTAS